MKNTLNTSFFNQPTITVAKNLIGKNLVRKIDNKIRKYIIIEVEAYDGHTDLACHGRFNKTKRNEPMFGPAGYFYIYLIYGMYWMLNIVTGPRDYPAAILIRGTKEISGPGRLTKHLKIDNKINNKLASYKTGLWFENNELIKKYSIIQTPRIGINYAGPIWSKKPYRFLMK